MATYPLRLAGWEDRSIIGSTSDPPEEWLNAPSPNDLTGPIAAATRTATRDVDAAIGQGDAELLDEEDVPAGDLLEVAGEAAQLLVVVLGQVGDQCISGW